jgi:hypothetical protein
MTDTVLFIFGVFITLIIIGSIGMLLWAASEDNEELVDRGDRGA